MPQVSARASLDGLGVSGRDAATAAAGLLGGLGVSFAVPVGFAYGDGGPAAVIVAVVVAVLVRRGGWFVSAAALAAGVGVRFATYDVPIGAAEWVVAAVAGVAIGGAGVAFAGLGPRVRAAAAVGLGAGLMLQPEQLWFLIYVFLPEHSYLALLMPSLLCGCAALIMMRATPSTAMPAADQSDARRESARLGLWLIGLFAVVAIAPSLLRLGFLPSAGSAELFHLATLALGIVVAGLAALAGRLDDQLARAVVAAAGAGMALWLARGLFPYPFAITGVVFVAAAASVVIAPRRIPWDVIGLCVASIGLLLQLGQPYFLAQDLGVETLPLWVGASVALASALGRVREVRSGGTAPVAIGVIAVLMAVYLPGTLPAPISHRWDNAAVDFTPAVWTGIAAVACVALTKWRASAKRTDYASKKDIR